MSALKKMPAPAISLTRARAQEIYAAKGKGLFGAFGCLIAQHETDDVEKMQRWLLKEYEGKRYIFWDEALAYIATGEVPPEK
jgi:hypothetical protein